MAVRTKTFLFVLSMLHVCASVTTQSCTSRYTHPHFALKYHVIHNISDVLFKQQCIDKCRLHQKCHSINFYKNINTCDLNEGNHLSNPESLLPSADGEYINFNERPPANCSGNLCSKPHPCLMDENDGDLYRCCTQAEVIIKFPRKSVEDYVIAENLIIKTLTAFTLSLWVKLDRNASQAVAFSYAINRNFNNEIAVQFKENKAVMLAVGSKVKSHSLSKNYHDDQWHHICYTYRSDSQKYHFYIDGSLKVQYKQTQVQHVRAGGAVALGQDQDSYKGGFQQYQSFKGAMSKINMWDKYMDAGECEALYRACSIGDEGNLIKWSDLYKNPLFGNLKVVCGDSCT